MDAKDVLESTAYAPVVARIYTSERFPHIFYDEKSLSLKNVFPSHFKGENTQNEYTLVGTAVRSLKLDNITKDFLKRNPNGVVVHLGCGLDTAFFRCDNGIATWYEVDYPEVINYRRLIIEDSERDVYIEGDAFKPVWIEKIRSKFPSNPILILAGGIFQYYKSDEIKTFFRMLKYYGKIEVAFEAFNAGGMKQMIKFINSVGREGHSFFTIDYMDKFLDEIRCDLISNVPIFKDVSTKGLSISTKLHIASSIKKNYCNIVHIQLY